MSSFEGKRVLVTGAGSGIGRATAVAFAKAGARVVVGDINADGLAVTAEQIGAGVLTRVFDVVDSAQFTEAVAFTQQELGGLDILVNNAGIELSGALLEMSDEDFDRSIAVNLRGVFNGIKRGGAVMAAGGGGAIVNLASVAALGGAPLMGAYCASKAGVVQLTRTAALELRGANVRVNAVLPGFIQTPMVDKARPMFTEMLGGDFDAYVALKQGRYGNAEDIAAAILHLSSDEASFITGQSYVADGGLSVCPL